MSRDQRVADNWALVYAQELALSLQQPLYVVFNQVPSFLQAAPRHFQFIQQGLAQVSQKLTALDIPFCLLEGQPEDTLTEFATHMCAGAIVTDFDPIKLKVQWKNSVAKALKCAFFEVDAHNSVPCWVASSKNEFGAYTLRPKINRLLHEYLIPIPSVVKHPYLASQHPSSMYVYSSLSNSANLGLPSGEEAAWKCLNHFIQNRLFSYAECRNDPNKKAQSGLSPYLHFGQISAQAVALAVMQSQAPQVSKEAFLEELIVRRELADNFCFYNSHYDSFEGFPNWAKKTLNDHREDPRPYLYSYDSFESATTHDLLWNAAQNELLKTGKMHGYMRMYWAKKILEWTPSPEEAMTIAIRLNDTYEWDGRDPNGYAGIAWSIGGVHDRAWFERPIFGKIRYMNDNGCRSKFDVKAYIEKWNP